MTEEPSANSRQMARAFRDMFIGPTQEGFTENQALVIIGQCISASFQNGQDK